MKRALAARLLQSPGMAASNSKSQTVTPESQSRLQKLLSIEPAEGNTTEFAHSQQEYNFRLCFLLWMLSTLMLPFFIIWYSWRSEARYSPTCHVTRPTVPRASACRLNADNADTRCRVQCCMEPLEPFAWRSSESLRKTQPFDEKWDLRSIYGWTHVWLMLTLFGKNLKKSKKKHEIMRFILYHFVICVFLWVFELPIFLSTADQLWDDCKGAEPMTGWTMHRMGVPFQTKRMYHLHPPVSCGFFGCEILYLL